MRGCPIGQSRCWLDFVIDIALISAPDRANNSIFGRPLLERLMMNCERAGIRKFVIAAPVATRADLARAMGQFSGRSSVSVIESFDHVLNRPDLIDNASACVALSGNLVMSKSNLAKAFDDHA